MNKLFSQIDIGNVLGGKALAIGHLDLTGEALGEIGAVSCWVRTGKEPRWSKECEDVD